MNPFFIRALNKLNCLKHLNVVGKIRINGSKVYIPVLSGIGFNNLNVSEFWMCDLIRYSLSVKKGLFVDIGANVGQTLIKLRTIDEEMHYVGFEPNPECVTYLNQLVKKNKFKNVNLIPVGLFDRDSILTLTLYAESIADPSASVIENFRNDKIHGKINIPVFDYTHIADLLGLNKIAIIKIDVEGAELEVLTSLRSAIIEDHPIIFVEILPSYKKDFTKRMERQNKIGLFVKELGYDILRVHKDTSMNKVERLEKLPEFDIHGNMNYSDYVLVPAGFSERMLNTINQNT